MSEKQPYPRNEFNSGPEFRETVGHLLNHPTLSREQEYIIFSIGQEDPLHPSGSGRIPRNEIPTRDVRNHPLFPRFLERFSDQNDQTRSMELLGISGTLADYLLLHYQLRVLGWARKYEGKGVPLDELFQEGNIGLSKAIEKYEYDRISQHTGQPTAFSSYSTPAIRNEMIDAIKRRWRNGLPFHVAAAGKIYRTVLDTLEMRLMRQPSETEIRSEFTNIGTIAPELVEFFLQGGHHPEGATSLDRAVLIDDEGNEVALIDLLPSTDNTEEIALTNLAETGLLSDLLATLPPNEAHILLSHHGIGGEKKSLRTLAADLSVSYETIRQLEWKAIETLRQMMQAHARGEVFTGLVHDYSYRSHFHDPNKLQRRTELVGRLLKQGYATKEISLLTGYTPGEVKYAAKILYDRGEIERPEKPQKKNETKITLAKELLAQGKPDIEVAVQVNKSLSSIQNIRKARQLKRNNPGEFDAKAGRYEEETN